MGWSKDKTEFRESQLGNLVRDLNCGVAEEEEEEEGGRILIIQN